MNVKKILFFIFLLRVTIFLQLKFITFFEKTLERCLLRSYNCRNTEDSLVSSNNNIVSFPGDREKVDGIDILLT